MGQVVSKHPYERDPQSGAGNCWCGWWEKSPMHGYPSPERQPAETGPDRVARAVRAARGGDAPVPIQGWA